MDANEARKLALEHAWKFFQLHAAQRLTLLNFFIIFFAAGCTGYFSALQAKKPIIATVVAIMGILLSFSFKLLDSRNSILIKAAEASLREQEKKINDYLKDESLNVFASAEIKNPKILSFRQIFNFIFYSVGAFSIIAFGVAVAAIR